MCVPVCVCVCKQGRSGRGWPGLGGEEGERDEMASRGGAILQPLAVDKSFREALGSG